MSAPPNLASVSAYARYWEQLMPGTIDQIDGLATEDFAFCDPFNRLTGREPFKEMLRVMFTRYPDARFHIDDVAMGRLAGYVLWRFTANAAGPKPLLLIGMTEVRYAPDGRVAWHQDHWDAAQQVYEQAPVLGPILRLVRRRLAHE